MSKIIQSITIKEGYTFTRAELDGNALYALLARNPEACDITYQKEETAKFPNGAEVFALENGAEYYCHNSDTGDISKNTWSHHNLHEIFLRNQLVFLDEDKARFSTKLEKRHLEITQKIYQINAENNWVEDWSDKGQSKYYCYWSHGANKAYFTYSYVYQSCGEVYYCEKAERYLKTLSEEDQKAFLLIYN